MKTNIGYNRHAKHTARGQNLAPESFQLDPKSPKLSILGLFYGKTIRMDTNITNLAFEYYNTIFLLRHEI